MQHAATILLPLFLAAVIYPVITGALTWYLWWDTPASWDAFAAAYPKQARAIRILRAVSPHLRKLVEVTRDDAARRSLPASMAVIHSLHPPVVGGRADEVALPRPPAPAPIEPAPFDPTAHITREQLPPVDGQRGSVDLGGLVGCLVVATVLGAALAGCPASRQLTRPALGAVDGCEPRATRCAPDGRPQVCSGSRRWTDADSVCATGQNVSAVCCLTRSPVTGATLHACVLAERCLPDAETR